MPEDKKKVKRNFHYPGWTQGSKKMQYHFTIVTRSNDFCNTVEQIRRDFKIPKKGYKNGKCIPPDAWIKKMPRAWDDYENLTEVIKRKISKKHDLHFIEWGHVLVFYIFYNKISEPGVNHGDLLSMGDSIDELEEPLSKEVAKEYAEKYPIFIGISPYAARDDIIDFIKKNYTPYIKPRQNKHKKKGVKIGGLRKRRKDERNQFIYSHEGKPLKQIGRLVKEKFGEYLDDGHISKIISIEKQGRK